MKIRSKILAGFMVVASVGVAIGTAGFVTTRMLSGIATELNAVQLESASISNVLNAHYVWRQRLTESVLSAEEFTGSLDPDTCALGTWYDSEEAQNMSDPELLSMLAAVDEPHSLIHTEAGDVAAYIEAGQLDEARRYLKEVILPKTEEVIGILTAMQARYSVLTEEKTAESVRIEEMVILVNAALIALAVVSGVFFAFFIANMVGKPLAPLTAFMNKAGGTGDLELTHTEEELIDRYAVKEDELGQAIRGSVAFIRRTVEVSKALETITSGDLTAEILPLSDKDTMGNSLIKMLGSFNGMFQNIQASTAQVSIAAKQVANGAQSLAQGSTEQSATVDELSGFISAIAEKTRINADMSGKAAKLAETIKESAEKGSRQMDEMMRAVGDINDASKNIGRILKTIDDIAFRTNILALNASVEAARAGQHGVGFAVVAEEVRNLAAKSAEASKDSGLMVQNSIEKAALGSRIAGDTAASLAEIVSGINQSGAMIEEIAKMSEEQSQGITRINNGIDQVTQVVRQNSATAQESAAASEEMSGQSAMLEEMIAQFKLRDSGAAHQGASLSERFVIPGNSGFALSEVREGYGKY